MTPKELLKASDALTNIPVSMNDIKDNLADIITCLMESRHNSPSDMKTLMSFSAEYYEGIEQFESVMHEKNNQLRELLKQMEISS